MNCCPHVQDDMAIWLLLWTGPLVVSLLSAKFTVLYFVWKWQTNMLLLLRCNGSTTLHVHSGNDHMLKEMTAWQFSDTSLVPNFLLRFVHYTTVKLYEMESGNNAIILPHWLPHEHVTTVFMMCLHVLTGCESVFSLGPFPKGTVPFGPFGGFGSAPKPTICPLAPPLNIF